MAQHTQNLKNTATRTAQCGLTALFSGNIFGNTFNIKAIRNPHLHRRSREESSMILTVIRFPYVSHLFAFKSYCVGHISLSRTQDSVLMRSLTLTDLHRMGISHEWSDVY